MIFLLLMSCGEYDPSVSSGTWVQTDIQVDFNPDCSMGTTFNGLQLAYQFGDYSSISDGGTVAIGSGSNESEEFENYDTNLWDMCSGSYSPRFYCTMPIVMTHYNTWKEEFPLYIVSEETGCEISMYGSTEGLFIDNTTIRLVSYMDATCTRIQNSGYPDFEDGHCEGRISSVLKKQSP